MFTARKPPPFFLSTLEQSSKVTFLALLATDLPFFLSVLESFLVWASIFRAFLETAAVVEFLG